MLKSEARIKEIDSKLAWLAQYVKFNNQQGMTDVNKAVEDFFRGLLNIMFNISLENMNYIERDYPAVDLGDAEAGLAIQVTSTSSREKVIHTLDRFFAHNLDQTYNRLIVLIVGKKEAYRKKFQTQRSFRFSKDEDIWDIDQLGAEISELEPEIQDAIIRYFDEQMQYPWEQVQKPKAAAPVRYEEPGEKKLKKYLPDTLGADGFRGRKKELAKLHQALQDNVNPIFITGLGGMGKTELAIRFCQKQPHDTLVHFARFAGSFRNTVSQAIAPRIENLRLTDYDDKSRPDGEIYRETMDVLRKCGSNTILVIDNADPADGDFASLKDDTYKELCRMNLRLVITSRAVIPDSVKVEEMDFEDLRGIIGKYSDCSDEDAAALIEAVDGHTLTVDLMARTMMGGWKKVTPKMLLDALKSSSLSSSIGKKVGSDYNREDKQAQIHEHLRAVFRVADIPPAAQNALQCATLLPEAGMNADLFCDALTPEAQAYLDDLSNRAWLRVNMFTNLATIHPVVRLVCHDVLAPSDASCGAFLNALWGQYDEKKYDHTLYTQMAEIFTAAGEKLENKTGTWSAHGRRLWQELQQYEKALTCARITLARREARLPADHPGLADAYNDMGLAYQGLEDCEGMEECFGKALEIRQRILAPDHPDLAKSYNNMGVVHERKKDYQTALQYKLRALAVFEKVLPEDDLDRALSLYHVGCTYYKMQEYHEALNYQQNALAIFSNILLPNHPHIADIIYWIGLSHYGLGDYHNALEYHKKALAIQKKVLPPEDPNIATSYSWIGSSYFQLVKYQHALEYQQKALAIYEKILSPDHPDIAIYYHNVSTDLNGLGDYRKALEYSQKALAIREKTLPPEHPDIALSYNEIGFASYGLSDSSQALEYHQKALAIREAALPADDPELATSYHNVGTTYLALKEYAQALEHLEKALQIREAKLPPGDPNIKVTKDAITICKRKLSRPSWMNQIN